MFMNSTSKTNRSVAVVEEAKLARENRAREKKRTDAAILIQSFVRRCLCVKHLRAENQREFDEIFGQYAYTSELPPTITAEDAFSHLRQFFFLFNGRDDQERFRNVCYYLIRSIACEKPQYSFMSILQKTEFVSTWRRQVLLILQLCVRYLRLLNPENVADGKDLVLYSQVIIMLTHASQWKAVKIPNEIVQKVMNGLTFKWLQELVKFGLYQTIHELLMRGMARSKPSFTNTTLFPLLTLTVRPMVQAAFPSEIDLQKTVIKLYTVPGLLLHVASICPEFIETLKKQNLLKSWNSLLTTDKAWLMLRQELTTANATLSMTANLLYAFWLDRREEDSEVEVLHAVSTIIFLLGRCREITASHQSAASKWHPILGWSSDRPDPSYQDSMGFVQQQLEIVYKKDFVRIVFGRSLERKGESAMVVKKNGAVGNSKALAMLHKLGLTVAKNPSRLQLGEGEVSRLAIVCAMYQTAINCLSRLNLNILTGLCAEGALPATLWRIIKDIGVAQFTELLKSNPSTFTTEFQLLGLFCNLTAHLITIMDDLELYEEQKIFTVTDLSDMSKFLNDLTFRIIWYEYMPAAQLKTDALFTSVHRLLQLLYQRNARRRFAPDEHWIMKEAKGSSFFSELKDKHVNAQQLLIYAPQCIPHHDRVKLFRQWIKEERAVMQETAKSPILITVQRRRIVEDGYQYISRLTPEELKGTVRVRFVNAEGVQEAGIDQDGVFKEFLEETLKSVFDPNLQLFKATADNRLYPSPNSSMQDNHIQLFNFVGRVLGKALYEGIVVDVPLANFFLSQVLGFHTTGSAYSYFDELPSFDLDLYKQLSNLKRYPGDVADFSLTFASDSECFGQVTENDLVPGGRYMEVTEENKILYIHLMAHWRMHGQIKQQINAFIQGFYAIVKHEWVSMFSSPELQKLISGSEKIDLHDLRKNTHYYGGFHSGHRIIGWLWDVLENDFNEEEKGLFLKFVTSCSKAPVLGFQYLEPPFSIRLVEVGEDQDSGDTLGSVIRGFFTVGNKKAASVGRLPTASTCFNLLKLPSYAKKSVLREKLKYAIKSNSGFELS